MDKNLVGRKVAFLMAGNLNQGIVIPPDLRFPARPSYSIVDVEGRFLEVKVPNSDLILVASDPEEFYNAWMFLYNHPAFIYDPDGLDFHSLDSLCVEVTKINPDTNQREDDATLNTKVEVWLEYGPYASEKEMVATFGENWKKDFRSEPIGSHDINLDCGAPTYEEAIIKLAELVKKWYNDDGTDRIYCRKCEKEILPPMESVTCRCCKAVFCLECNEIQEELCLGCYEYLVLGIEKENGN